MPTQVQQKKPEIEIIARIPKSQDIETHVRIIEIDGVEVVELRDFIVSLHEYGRGYWINCDGETLDALVHACVQVRNSL